MKEGTTGRSKKNQKGSAVYRVMYPSGKWEWTEEMAKNSKVEAFRTLYEKARKHKILAEE